MLKEKLLKPLIMLMFFAFSIQLTMAQGGTQVSFGQNRVQYHDFDWLSHESDHFITYFYPGGQELGKFVIIAAEDRIRQLEERLNFVLSSKIELLIYNDITDLSQTNIGISEGTYNVGGTNYSDGTKIFLYFDGNHSNMLNMLEKELTKVYLNSMMAGRNFAEIVQNAVFLNLPAWYISGMAAYFGEEWNVQNDDRLRKFWNETSRPSFAKLAQLDPEFAGHSLWYFIFEKYGSTSVKNLLYLTRINRSINKGFVFALGKSYDNIIEEWEQFYKFHAKNDIAERERPKEEFKVKTRLRKNQIISQIKISPDGRNLAYSIHKHGQYKAYVQNVETKRRKRIFKGGFNSENYPHDQSYPILAWNPASSVLIGIHEKRDQVKQVDYDIVEKKKTKSDLRGFQRVYQASFSVDGRSLVLSAQNRGQTDIYTYNLVNKTATQLTNDIFDDAYPVMLEIEGTRGILFSSNRPDENIQFATYDSILPVGKSAMYFLDLQNPAAKFVKIGSDGLGGQSHGLKLDDESFAFLSDENGIVNLYKGELHPAILRFDTITEGETIRIDTIRYFTASVQPLTDISTNILDASIASRVGKWAYLVKGIKKSEVYIAPVPREELPLKLTSTAYRNSLTSLQKAETVLKRTERVTKNEIEAVNNVDTLINQNFEFTFNSRYNYTLPTSAERQAVRQQFLDSVRIESEETYQQMVSEEEKPLVQFRAGQSVPYRAKFSSSFLTTQIDNSVLPFTYQSVALNGSRFDYPNLSGMIMFGIQDLMEDHKLTGGFRLPSNFKGTEIFVSYENLKKRLDKRLFFYRKSNQERLSLLVNNTYIIPAVGKQKTNYMETRLSYPFDVTKSLRLYAGYRNDRLILGYTDTITMMADIDRNENWSFLKLEFVHDNSREVQTNIFNGFRYKIYTEYFRNWSEKNSNLFTFGFDARHYTTVFKNVIWANRLAGASSFGQRKVIYYLGGVDTWLNNKYDNSIGVSNMTNYAFQAQATNVRGFPINIRNGSSNMVYNSELRVPIFSLLAKKNIKSAFISNFQLLGFFDIGSAYNGLTPFNQDNPYVTEQVTPNGQQTPVVVKVDYYRNPTVMGTGFGIRTVLLGYFMRLDWAWGLDGGLVSKKPMWMFSFSKDF